MNGDLERLRNFIERLPVLFVIPLSVFLYYASVLIYVACLPFVLIYRMLLLPRVWIEWERQRKDTLLIYSDDDHSRDWMQRLEPLVGNRAVVLNWADRRSWDPSELPVQLFEMFGPRGIPERFTARSLPAALLFRQLRNPERFLFGTHSRDIEDNFQRFRQALGSR